jgi:hypothetical protein
MEIFDGVRDARSLKVSLREEYNTQRPDNSLEYRTPAGFAAASAASASAKAAAPAAHARCLGKPVPEPSYSLGQEIQPGQAFQTVHHEESTLVVTSPCASLLSAGGGLV